jgi:hypothetical protein
LEKGARQGNGELPPCVSLPEFRQNHLAKVRVAGASPVARSDEKCRLGALFKGPYSRIETEKTCQAGG